MKQGWPVSATIATAFLIPATAIAEDGTETWDGTIELSAADASGNSDTTNLGLAIKAKRKIGRFLNTLTASANFAEAEGAETQNNWVAAWQVDADIGERTRVYGRIQYEEDQFSGFDNRLFLGAGVGHFLLQDDRLSWKVEAGPGYRLSTIETPAAPVPASFDDQESEFAIYGSSNFDLTVREGVLLEHDLNTTYTDSNTTVSSVLGLSTKLTELMSSKVSYQVDYETDPPEGREDTDTLLKASVLVTY